jgi:5-hydroxyisourate hydrolase-like protein (transthyretin family)
MKLKISIAFLALLILNSCRGKSVNSDYDAYIPVGPAAGAPSNDVNIPAPNEIITSTIGRPSNVAIDGKIMAPGEIPVPLSHIEVGLYRNDKETWREVTRLTTETDGSFRITQKLADGHYELRVLDKRYSGIQALHLNGKPIRGLMIAVTKK